MLGSDLIEIDCFLRILRRLSVILVGCAIGIYYFFAERIGVIGFLKIGRYGRCCVDYVL